MPYASFTGQTTVSPDDGRSDDGHNQTDGLRAASVSVDGDQFQRLMGALGLDGRPAQLGADD